ncbi:hypothetical protein [Nonomuraea endophytica]|uniref:hypothetical protein n=1 Tax=Nonomuraea endophytica TaxID=714136 RepID=UPI0037C6D9AA
MSTTSESSLQSPLVESIVARADELLAAIPDLLSREELRAALGLAAGDWMRGQEAGAIPAPDADPYWTRAAADALIACAEQVRAALAVCIWCCGLGPALGRCSRPDPATSWLVQLTANYETRGSSD